MTRARSLPIMLASSAALMAACARPADDGGGPRAAQFELAELLGGDDTLHARALEPRAFTFPVDHGPHPEFRAEWWYFTGNLTATDGRELGYQLTFFRSALADSASYVRTLGARFDQGEPSAWRGRHAYMAHFAVSDAREAAFHAAQRFGRSGAGLAGARAEPFRVWLGGWHAESETDGMFPLALVAADGDVAIDLMLDAGKPLVLQGERGLSRKGAAPGNASYYYSRTRMPTRGTVRIGGTAFDVTGTSWLDREWSTSALAPGVEGWDWLSLQLDDGTELMLYRLRREDGTADPFSAGTFVRADGSSIGLSAAAFRMTPLSTWGPAGYPTAWRIHVPSLDLELGVRAAFDAQELDLAVRYWEGMVRVDGTRGGLPLGGRGYLEMTGY